MSTIERTPTPQTILETSQQFYKMRAGLTPPSAEELTSNPTEDTVKTLLGKHEGSADLNVARADSSRADLRRAMPPGSSHGD